MNIKLHTPKTLKGGSGLSSLKQLLLSFMATSISIVLTFGTAALIDHRKKEAEKHEMVLMILNDFSLTIQKTEEIDSTANRAFETQLAILENPETFEARSLELSLLEAYCKDETLKMVENIFSSNIETVNTLGNILFAEKVSEFYQKRQTLYANLAEFGRQLFESENSIVNSYDNLAKTNIAPLVNLCDVFLDDQRQMLQQCQQMMDVSDEELAAFSRERQKWNIGQPEAVDSEERIKAFTEKQERFSKAVETGRKKQLTIEN